MKISETEKLLQPSQASYGAVSKPEPSDSAGRPPLEGLHSDVVLSYILCIVSGFCFVGRSVLGMGNLQSFDTFYQQCMYQACIHRLPCELLAIECYSRSCTSCDSGTYPLLEEE